PNTLEAQGGADELTLPSQPTTDKAAPVLVKATAKDLGSPNLFNANGDRLNLSFSEPMTIGGSTSTDKWLSLENAILFTHSTGAAGCVEGSWPTAGFNFPQPRNSSSTSAISFSGSTMTVTLATADSLTPSNGNQFYAVPVANPWCKLGIDSSAGKNSGLTDLANNAADVRSTAQLVYPVDATLATAKTIDKNHDGVIDGVELAFDQAIDDSTVKDQLSNIHVSLGGVVATFDASGIDDAGSSNGIDTAGTANDKRFNWDFKTPIGVSWDSGITPHVSYAKPASCTATSGAGIKANLPTGGYQACMASFDLDMTDGASPIITAARALDANTNGKLDKLEVTFSEPIAVAHPAGWAINGSAITNITIDATNSRKAAIVFPEGANGDTAVMPTIAYATQTLANATVDASPLANQVIPGSPAVVDAAAPRVISAKELDPGHTGSITEVDLTYSEPLASDGSAGDFTVGGLAATASSQPDGHPEMIALTVDVPGTSAAPVAFTPGSTPVADAAGNASGTQTVSGVTQVLDQAAPVSTMSIVEGAPMNAGLKHLTITYSESMDTATPPTVSLTGNEKTIPVSAVADANHTNGFVTADPTKWEGTFTVSATDCSQSVGCPYTLSATDAKDKVANAQVPGTLNTSIDTVAPNPPVLGSFAATEEAGQTVPDNTINMFTRSFSLSGSFITGEATDGKAQLLVDGQALTPGAFSGTVGSSDTSATAATNYASTADLVAAIADGQHALSLQLCDASGNCSVSATTLTVTADHTPIANTQSSPTGGNIVGGGTHLTIAWSGDSTPTDFSSVVLEYSTDNGAQYAVIASGQALSGSYDWTVPSIDAAQAIVRSATIDQNGNKGYAASSPFAIDSQPPVVSVPTPSFVGGATTIHWNATDATIDQASSPITIQYSTDDGAHWNAINGGTYAHDNDGQETWNVPAGGGFYNRIRITAIDATGKSTTVTSGRFARGVDGYVSDWYGNLVSYGSANPSTHRASLPTGTRITGVVLRPDGTAGYVVSSRGLVYSFSTGTNAIPARPSATDLRSNIANGIVLRTSTSGYVLDIYGKIHPFGGAPAAHPSKTFTSNLARAIVLRNSDGGYVLDAYGRLNPFSVGSAGLPARPSFTTLSSARATAFVMRTATSGWVLDNAGRIYPFGGAPSRTSTGISSTAQAKAIVLIASDSGYWMDGRGVFHAFGIAYGNPTKATLSSYRAIGATS
ncbi:MAG: Ser-Thr-rich GPI-anchored membrane family protein, partial [Actinomycetota bacterium]